MKTPPRINESAGVDKKTKFPFLANTQNKGKQKKNDPQLQGNNELFTFHGAAFGDIEIILL